MELPVEFIEEPAHYLSPFSAHRIEIWGEVFATVEHAYQAARVKHSREREEIKNASSPMDAWRLGQECKKSPSILVEDFDKDAVMEELLREKFRQHSDVREILCDTGDRLLLKNYDTDYYWGTGADGSGKNIMGLIWMKIRSEQNL